MPHAQWTLMRSATDWSIDMISFSRKLGAYFGTWDGCFMALDHHLWTLYVGGLIAA
jgi:hypothetical protein